MTTHNPHTIYLKNYSVPDYLIDKVDLTVNLDEDVTTVDSTMSVRVNPESQNKSPSLVLNGVSLELTSILLDGKQLTAKNYQLSSDSLTISSVPSTFTLQIQTRIRPQDNTSLSGLYKSSGNFCTQCEAEGFRRITYFLDRPDVMAQYKTTIIADQSRYPVLLSNGNSTDSGKLENGKYWVCWEDPFKKPSYLFALVAGNLECVEDYFVTQSGRRVVLRIYVEQGNQDKCAHAMQAVKKAMRWDEEKFGREYDLDIYMIVAVSDFNMGAMENKGLNIFNTKYILAKKDTATDEDFIHVESVIAHEYFHNWTGNRITCRDWFQLSLKEGLTIFRDQSFTADTTSPAVARIQDVIALRTQQFPEDAGPLAHPVRPESYIEINNFYTATVYNKGAEVIRMMKTILGDTAFRKGMDLYFERHDGHAVTINDFVKAMEDASGINLTQFCIWYSQAGTPKLKITENYNANQKIYTLTIQQSCDATPGQKEKKPFHIPVKIGLLDKKGNELPLESSILHVTQATQSFDFKNISEKPTPSLLRAFSAPVKIQFDYSNYDLEFLFKHDQDEFNRWEAGQQYAIDLIMKLVKVYQAGEHLLLPFSFIEAFRHVLTTQQQDKWLLAEMLTLPSLKYLTEQMSVIDVDAIFAVREFVLLEMATQLQDLFFEIYQDNHSAVNSNDFNIGEVGKRQLKNVCLYYLMLLSNKSVYIDLGVEQFHQSLSSNMTDTVGALRCFVNSDSPRRAETLDAFYEYWQDDALVLDKWFALQATSKLPDTLSTVKKLMSHKAFDIKNPNKVYALIGAFGHQNLKIFHAIDGSGYAFLSNVVQQLDVLNPQIAARMIRPLIDWKRYDKVRQGLMLAELEKIVSNKGLSKDVYELVSKSLSE